MFQQQCNASICKCLEVNLNIQRINFLNKIKIVSSSMYTEQKYKHSHNLFSNNLSIGKYFNQRINHLGLPYYSSSRKITNKLMLTI